MPGASSQNETARALPHQLPGVTLHARRDGSCLDLLDDAGRSVGRVMRTAEQAAIAAPDGREILVLEIPRGLGARPRGARGDEGIEATSIHSSPGRHRAVRGDRTLVAFAYPVLPWRSVVEERIVDGGGAVVARVHAAALGVRIAFEPSAAPAERLAALGVYVTSLLSPVPPPSVPRYLRPRAL
jgi:hypothetical protein